MKATSRLQRAVVVVLVIALASSLVLPSARAPIVTGAVLLLFLAGASHVTAWASSLRAPRPAPFERALARRSRSPDRPPDLESLERTLGWRAYSRRDFDHRVRPLLRRLIAFKLLASRGIDADADHKSAVSALPDDLRWLLSAHDAPGDGAETINTARIDRLLRRIEAL